MAVADHTPSLVLDTTAPAVGGEAVARDPSGRVVFVSGALPGERVAVALTDERRDFARGRVVEVLDPSPHRTDPPCPHVARGCGGCDLQHVAAGWQPELKRAAVVDALTRIGKVTDPEVRLGPPLPSSGYRTTVRAAVVDGRAGFRRRRSHDVVVVDDCLVAHPLVAEVLTDGRFGPAREVTVRAGAATDERLVVVAPRAGDVTVPDDVVVVGDDESRRGRGAAFHEMVAGHRFRISARSFFQANRDGAEALVSLVRQAADDALVPGARVVDAYAGVGLFSAAVAAGDDRRVTALEWSRSSVDDARHNLARVGARVVRTDVARWSPSAADVVIADPSRRGLGADAVATLSATGASRFVLVGCDVAAFARDLALLGGEGFRLVHATLVDLFPHTHHVEVVGRLDRDG